MQVFKAAMKVFTRHIIYISVYLVALSMMGVFIGMGTGSAPQSEFSAERPEIAVIDRDGSELSRGLTDFLGENATLVAVEDSRQAMQDATAQNFVQYIMIIPEGFGEGFVAAASYEAGVTAGTGYPTAVSTSSSAIPPATAPATASATASATSPTASLAATSATSPAAAPASVPPLETVVSSESIAANMMNGLVDEYLNTARTLIESGVVLEQTALVQQTSSAMTEQAAVTTVEFGESAPASQQWVIYMRFVSYTVMVSTIVCIGVILAAFNRTETRRRDGTSPVSTLSRNLQIAAACIVVALIAWAWTAALGLIVFGQSLGGVALGVIALSLLALLALCAVALAIGFLFGQLSSNEVVINAGGNIISLVVSFFGGLWIPLEFVGESMKAVAHFVPTFYYAEAFTAAVNLQDFSSASLAPVFANIGIVLLFAVAIFAVALAIGKLRAQTATAGGNAAAARTAG